jgi:hypothetical protein
VCEPFAELVAWGDFFEPEIDLGLLFGEAAWPKPVNQDARAVGFGGCFVDTFESGGQMDFPLVESGAVASVLHGGEFFVAGPRDCEKKGGIAFGFDIVADGVAESEERAGGEIVGLALDVNANLPLENLDGDGAVGVVLFHVGGVLHGDEDDTEVVFFEQCSGVDAGRPGLLVFGVGDFFGQIELSDFVDHGSVLQRSCHGELLFRQEVYASCGLDAMGTRMEQKLKRKQMQGWAQT